MRILIIGAGAINRNGMTVRGVWGTFTARPRAEARPERLAPPFHVVEMELTSEGELVIGCRP